MSCRCLVNTRAGTPGAVLLSSAGFRRAKTEITAWPSYAPTPLIELPTLARAASVGAVALKDEAGRFGLGSFKALGGAYAVAQVMLSELARRGVAASATTADLLARRYAGQAMTVACATDGNHGRSVAWGAQLFGAQCCIFVHETVSAPRIDAIARYGAEVRRVPGTYDDAVRAAAAVAAAQGWFVVADTSWPGYTEVPRLIMQGYRLMADEAIDQWRGPPPTHAFIQCGVGGVAAAVAVQLRSRLQPAPHLTVVEPERAACLFASIEAGRPVPVAGTLDTIMAGLACGELSLLAWQELERAADAVIMVDDAAAIDAMRRLAALGVVSGESGAAGLAALLAAAADPAVRKAIRLEPDSRLLLFSTEGATDPELYARLIA